MSKSIFKKVLMCACLCILPYVALAGDDKEGGAQLTEMASKEDPMSQWLLGVNYYENKNYAEAFKWFRKAATQGVAPAQFSLGLMYLGNGIQKDDAEAAKWFRKAAEQGHTKAQFYLGSMYEDGSGVKQDYTEAINLYRKSAAQGDNDAQNNLRVLRNKMGWYATLDTWMANDLMKKDSRFYSDDRTKDLTRIIMFLDGNSEEAQKYKADAIKRFEQERDVQIK